MTNVYCKPYDIRFDDTLPDGTPHVNIRFWCHNRESRRVLVRVQDFFTMVRIELPTLVNGAVYHWTDHNIEVLEAWLKNALKSDAPVLCQVKKYRPLYYEQEPTPFLVAVFSNLEAQRHCVNLLRKEKTINNLNGKTFHFKVWEHDIDPVRKLLTIKNQQYTQWFSFPANKAVNYSDSEERISKPGSPNRPTDEYLVSYKDITPVSNTESSEWLTKPRLLGYDFETYSDNHKTFPDSYNIKHAIFNISCIGIDDKDPQSKVRYSLLYGKANKPDNCIQIETQSEVELLDKFERVIDEYDPDVLTGYNIFGFDNEYFANRKKIHAEEIYNFTCLKEGKVNIEIKKWRSSGFGYNIMYIMDVEGRLSIDLLPIIKRDYKLSMYTLSFVSREIINKDKHDVTAPQMFRAFEENQTINQTLDYLYDKYDELRDKSDSEIAEELNGLKHLSRSKSKRRIFLKNIISKIRDNDDRDKLLSDLSTDSELPFESKYNSMQVILDYCLQDSELVIELFNKMNQWISLSEMSAVVGVTITQLFTRGQQVRTYSLLYHLAWHRGFVITKRFDFPIIPYSGAFVVSPIVGLHDNVLCEDFAALYPSIIRANNFCYTTLKDPNSTAIILEENNPEVLAKYTLIQVNQENGLALKEEDDTDLGAVDNPKKDEEDDDDEKDKDENEGEDNNDNLNLSRIDEDDEPLDPDKDYTEYTFLWSKEGRGLIPQMMDDLVGERNMVKEELKGVEKELKSLDSEKDKERIEILLMKKITLDKRQLALKVTANSGYGFLGAQLKGMLPLIEAAMCVTHLGKRYIRRCIRYLIQTYGATIIYGDTDSVMFTIPGVTGKDCDAWGKRLATELSALFPPPLKLEFEKAMRMISFKKKKYASYLIKKDGTFVTENDMKKNGSLLPYILVRGIVIARRDNCSLLRDFYLDLLRAILDNKDICDSYEIIIRNVLKLLYQELDPAKELSVVKTLNAQYKSESCQMKVFGDKLNRIGKPAKPGERLSYLVLTDEHDNTPQALKIGEKMILSEDYDPEEHQIDMVYYLSRLLEKPIDQLFSVGYMNELDKYKGFCYQPIHSRKQSKDISTPIQMISLMLQDAHKGQQDFNKARHKIKKLPKMFSQYTSMISCSA